MNTNVTDVSSAISNRPGVECDPEFTIDRMRQILKERGLTLNQISRLTALPPFNRNRHYFIHHGFYDQIREGQEPHLFQLAALSEITGARLNDWMVQFGYDVDDILRFQLVLHASRTILLSLTVHEETMAALMSGFHAVKWPDETQRLAAVAPVVTKRHVRVARDTLPGYLYVKVGADCLMPSHLPAGSLARVDPRRSGAGRQTKRPIFAVEHLYGVSLCFVEGLGSKRIRLVSYNPPPWPPEFDLETQAVVLGAADHAIVPLREQHDAGSMGSLTKARPQPLVTVLAADPSLHAFVQTSRQRIGLTFQEAEQMGLRIAAARDRRYAVGQGTLSDYEASDVVPRHIPKIITLCSIYAMDFWRYARTAGLRTGVLHGPDIPRQAD